MRSIDDREALDEFRLLRGAARDAAYLQLEVQRRRIEALQAAMVHDVASTCSFVDDRHSSPTSWVQAVINSSKGTAMRRVRDAAMFAANPDIAAAAAAGDLGDDQVRQFAKLWGNVRVREQLTASQALLLHWARRLRAREFELVCLRWLAHADPDGARLDGEASREHRYARLSMVGEGFTFTAEGDIATGEVLQTLLDEQIDREYARDVADRAAQHGPDAAAHPLPRTHRQRSFDAMVNLMLRGANALDPNNREPLVNLVCTPDVLIDALIDLINEHGAPEPEAGAPDDEHQPVDEREREHRPDADPDVAAWEREIAPAGTPCRHCGRSAPWWEGLAQPEVPGMPGSSARFRLCETVNGVPVDPRVVAIAAIVGKVRRVVKDSTGLVIDLGRARRLFSGSARDAVLLMGGRCCWPGCDQRVGIQIDHMLPWTGGGGTRSDNGAPVCGHHNREKHEGGYTIVRDHAGWHVLRPDGTPIGMAPEPIPDD